MAQENNIAQQLNDLLVTRDFHPDMRDSQGKVCDSSEAKVFTFDYVSGAGKDYGTMVIILDSGNDLKAMFGNNLGRGMEDADKDEWYEFQQQLSQFANSHRWTYTGDDISKLKYTMQGLAAIKEGLFEGYYGTRRISYAGEPTQARLMIRHNRNLGENDARFRYVESIFVETADGERHRLPFTNLAGGRAMLEHVRQGGKPYDVRGNHICEMITELKVLARFNRASQGRVVEGVKQSVVQGAQTYYKSLRENIKRMASPRGYTAYFESWHPTSITEQDQLVEDIKTLFVEQTIDDRIEQALPLLAKIQQGREMKEADIFENWVNNVTEGTWSLPETPEQMTKLKELMSGELIVGPDGTNATEQLYDLIGDDVLFDRIDALAAQDPRANVWDDTDVQARMQELGIQMPDRAAPDMAAEPQPQQGVAEDQLDEIGDTPAGQAALQQYQDKAGNQVAAHWQQVHNKSHLPTDTKMAKRNAGTVAAGNRIHGFGIAQNQQDKVTDRFNYRDAVGKTHVYQKNDPLEQGMSEADNISTFESLQRMRHLSGMPLKENVLNDIAKQKLAHIMTTYQRDVRDFIQSGNMSDHLYDALYDYYFDDMPYGVKKARSGDPYEWIGDRFAEDILSNAPADTPHQSDGQTVGQVMSQVGTRGLSGRPAPLTECNYTMEGEYCPEHGLSECWSQGMYEDILSTGIQLAEDDKTNEGFRDKVLQTIFKTEPKIARSSMDNLGTVSTSPNALLAPARSKEAADMQAWNKLYPETPWTPASDEDLLKSFNHDLNVRKNYGQASRESMPNDFLPTGAARAARTQGAAFDAEKSMQSNQDRIKDAYGIDEDGNVNEADRAQGFAAPGFQSDWWKSTPAGQAKTQPAPAKTPSADVTKDPLFRAAMNRIDADNKGNSRSRYFLPHSDEPVVQPPGVGPQPEPDTDIPDSDGPYPVAYGNRDDLGPPVFDQEPPLSSHPVLTGTVNQNGTVDFGPYSYRRDKAAPPLSSLDNAPPLPNSRVASVRSLDNAPPLPNSRVEPVDVTRESREGDALLARIKSLALIK